MPVDVRRIPREGSGIEVKFGEKVAKLPSWEWELKKPMRLSQLTRRRLCLYGKGVVEPLSKMRIVPVPVLAVVPLPVH